MNWWHFWTCNCSICKPGHKVFWILKKIYNRVNLVSWCCGKYYYTLLCWDVGIVYCVLNLLFGDHNISPRNYWKYMESVFWLKEKTIKLLKGNKSIFFLDVEQGDVKMKVMTSQIDFAINFCYDARPPETNTHGNLGTSSVIPLIMWPAFSQ